MNPPRFVSFILSDGKVELKENVYSCFVFESCCTQDKVRTIIRMQGMVPVGLNREFAINEAVPATVDKDEGK